MRVLIVNGPPRSGKTTAIEILRQLRPDWAFDAMSRPLKEMTHMLYEPWKERSEKEATLFEDMKDAPHPIFLGLSAVQAYHLVSERYLKPTHGPGILGKILAEQHDLRWKRETQVLDAGCPEEIDEYVRCMGYPAVVIVRLHRFGVEFLHDLRQYVSAETLTVPVEAEHDVINDTKDQLEKRLHEIVNDL